MNTKIRGWDGNRMGFEAFSISIFYFCSKEELWRTDEKETLVGVIWGSIIFLQILKTSPRANKYGLGAQFNIL